MLPILIGIGAAIAAGAIAVGVIKEKPKFIDAIISAVADLAVTVVPVLKWEDIVD
jgi:hypothetical protein